jgi:hypothetical protein
MFVVIVGRAAAENAALFFLKAESMLVDFADGSFAIFTDSLISRTHTHDPELAG